jgi:hypothetical protein
VRAAGPCGQGFAGRIDSLNDRQRCDAAATDERPAVLLKSNRAAPKNELKRQSASAMRVLARCL